MALPNQILVAGISCCPALVTSCNPLDCPCVWSSYPRFVTISLLLTDIDIS